MTATWLLPIIPLIVSSSTGGLLAAPLLQFSTSKSLVTLVFATVSVIMGLTLAFMMLTLYFLRLVLHGIPRSGGVVSVYIPLGPVGQGGYSILLLGSGYNAVLPLHYGNSTVLRWETVGQIVSVATLAIAVVLWVMGTLWLIYGLMATADVLWNDHVHFKQAFWSLIFPNVSPTHAPPPMHARPRPSAFTHRLTCGTAADPNAHAYHHRACTRT